MSCPSKVPGGELGGTGYAGGSSYCLSLSSLSAGNSGASLPPCQVTEEDLTANPGLATLLQGLAGHMDASGLSTGLARQLQQVQGLGVGEGEPKIRVKLTPWVPPLQVQRELQLQRVAWLRWECLHRLLQEALLKADTGSAPRDKKVRLGFGGQPRGGVGEGLKVKGCSPSRQPPEGRQVGESWGGGGWRGVT